MENSKCNWASIPDLALEIVFSNLSFGDRFNASLVCQNWSIYFRSPGLWHQLKIDDNWFRKKVQIQIDVDIEPSKPTLDYDRASAYLKFAGKYFRSISIQPSENFDLLYQALSLLLWFFELNAKPSCIYSFEFCCQQLPTDNLKGIKYFGIGGQIITLLVKLMQTLNAITDLQITNLMMERYEANKLMDTISIHINRTIKKLSLINLTMNHCRLHQLDMFTKLETLKLSPQNIDENLLKILAKCKLKDFWIIQNELTPKTAMPCDKNAWRAFKIINVTTRVHLYASDADSSDFSGYGDVELLIQPAAPIYSVTCKNLRHNYFQEVTDNYSGSIATYIEMDRNSARVCDEDLIEMVKECHYLTSVEISRSISAPILMELNRIRKSFECRLMSVD